MLKTAKKEGNDNTIVQMTDFYFILLAATTLISAYWVGTLTTNNPCYAIFKTECFQFFHNTYIFVKFHNSTKAGNNGTAWWWLVNDRWKSTLCRKTLNAWNRGTEVIYVWQCMKKKKKNFVRPSWKKLWLWL